jgi:hypothetical protein
VHGHRNPVAPLDSADVGAQVVLELAEANHHTTNVAICGNGGNVVRRGLKPTTSIGLTGLGVVQV